MTKSLVDPAIDVLASTPGAMRALLGPLPDELRLAEDRRGWCARDVVAHLALRQRPAIVGRVSAILSAPGGRIPDVPAALMDPTPWRVRPFDDVLREFHEGRDEAVELLRGLTSEQLLLRGTHSAIGEVSIADVVHHVAYHDLAHVAQAAQLAFRPLEPLRGAMRAFH